MSDAVKRVEEWLSVNEDHFPIPSKKSCSRKNPDRTSGECVIFGDDIRAIIEENKRLREALHFYADNHQNPNDGPWGAASDDYGDTARAALNGEDK